MYDYDLIVIGEDLSSHVAAAIAANYGLKTILIAEHGTGGVFLFGDYAFNIDPTPLSGFGLNQTFLSLLAELDLPPIEREGKLLNPAYQVILPEHRIDFFNEKEALLNEMVREFPQYAGEINSFYDSVAKQGEIFSRWLHDHPFIQPKGIDSYCKYLKLTPSLIKHRIECNKFKRLLNTNSSLKKIFEAQEALLCSTKGNGCNFSASLQYCLPFRGIYHFQQGKQIIFNSLVQKLEEKKGFYLAGCEIVNIKKGKMTEIEVVNKSKITNFFSAKYLIVSTKWKSIQQLLLTGNKYISFADRFKQIKISHLPLTIHLVCDRKCIPEKMANHSAVVTDIHKNIFDDNLIILETGMLNDKVSESPKLPLSATIFLPADQNAWKQENIEVKASNILDRLESFLPFLRDGIEFFDLDKSIQISKEAHEVYNPKYTASNSLITGFTARSNKTRFKNIYLTGASLILDAGFEGEIISGMNAASLIISRRCN